VSEFFKKSYGFNDFYINKIKLRFEFKLFTKIRDLSKSDFAYFLIIIYKTIPHKSSIKKRTVLNAYKLDIISSYKG